MFDIAHILYVLLIITENISITTKTDGETYQPVNTEPLLLQHALFTVQASGDDHIALIYDSGEESAVIYEIILGRDSDSAIILHTSEQPTEEVRITLIRSSSTHFWGIESLCLSENNPWTPKSLNSVIVNEG